MMAGRLPFPVNDGRNGWQLGLPTRPEYGPISGECRADYVVVGAGFTGLAAARRLAELKPEAEIVVIDAEAAGGGASSRNSGFIVEASLHEGGRTHDDNKHYLRQHTLKKEAIKRLKRQVEAHQIACDWDEAGKYHCTTRPEKVPVLSAFARKLAELGVAHTTLDAEALSKRLGTSYYRYAVHTLGGVLVNPAALVAGLLRSLPGNVRVFEHSPVTAVERGRSMCVHTPNGVLRAEKMLVAVNAFLPHLQGALGLRKQRVFPLTLTASLTRQLSDTEYAELGSPAPWGVLSLHPMGATVRLTNDRRLLIRNTAEWCARMHFSAAQLNARSDHHRAGLRKRFPGLVSLDLEASWSGNVCISRNTRPVFEAVDRRCYVAGGYNAGGIGPGSLFGELLAEYALGQHSDTLATVLAGEHANQLPPAWLFFPGLRAHLAVQRMLGRREA